MNEEAELKFRQERISGKPLSGFDLMIQKSLPSWLKKGGIKQDDEESEF